MKKRIVKLIALSMLPMTLMSFKGKEEIEQVDGNKIISQIKKAYTPTFDSSKVDKQYLSSIGSYISIESLLEEEHAPDESTGQPDPNAIYYLLDLSDLWNLPQAKNAEFAVLAFVEWEYRDIVTGEKNHGEVSNYDKVLSDSFLATSSTGKQDINVIPFGSTGSYATDTYSSGIGSAAWKWDDAIVVFVNDPNVLRDGESKDVYVNVDNPTTLDQIKTGIHLQDTFGNDVPVQYAVKDGSKEYDPSKLGTYSYVISGESHGQAVSATLNIIVKDTVAPTISNPTPVSVPYSQGLKLSDLDGKFVASDNATDKGGTIDPLQYFVGDTQIDSDHPYAIPVDQAKTGRLSLTVKATDSSGNLASSDFDVTITDDKSPEILSGGKEVAEGAKFKTSLKLFQNADSAKSAFLAGFSAQDEIDSDAPSVEVVNFPTLDNVVVGDNEVTLSAVDHAGNRKNVNVIVEVTNDQLPVFVFDSFLVSATSDNPLTADQLATLVSDHLYNSLNVVVSKEDIRVASSNYEENARRPGKYSVQYTYRQADGTYSDAGSFDVMVSGAKETSWWDDFIKALSDFFQRLWNWLRGKGWKTNAEIHDEEVLSSGKDA